VILDKVALHWHPITAAECQAATHLDVNVVSAQLSRLVKSGVLTKVELPGPGKLGFQLSERFFNIWYLMRASRRLRRRLSWFVEFVRIFYGEEELKKRAEELIRATPADSLSNPAKFLAFATAIPDEALRRRLEFRAICLLADQETFALRELVDLEGEDVHLAPAIDRVRTLREIRARIAAADIEWPSGLTSDEVADTLVRTPLLPIRGKQHASQVIREASASEVNGICDLVVMLQKHRVTVPERLLSAVATGEVPSFYDVTELDEARQVIELMESRAHAVSLLVLFTEAASNPLRDHILKYLLDSEPSASDAILRVAGLNIHDWPRARHLILLIIRYAAARLHIEGLTLFLEKCITAGLAREALALFIEAGLAERWVPLYEALCAAVEDDASRLDRLAPEMQKIARDLYGRLRNPAPRRLDEASSIASPAPPRRRAAKNRAGPGNPSSDHGRRTGRRRPKNRPA
jgi:hypothetical protein